MPKPLATVRINLRARRVFQGDKEIILSPKQFALLAMLLRDSGAVITREEIYREVWGAREVTSKCVDIFIMKLRKTLGPGYITTVRGHGFRWDGPDPGDPIDIQQLRAELAAKVRALGAMYPEDAFPADTVGGGMRTMAEMAARLVEGDGHLGELEA